MLKAELEKQNAELKAQLEELKKGETTMANNNTADKTAKTNDFNVFDYVKTLLVVAKQKQTNEIRMRQTNQGVLSYLKKVGAISNYEIFISDTFIDENGKHYVLVKVDGINLNAKATSKAGKEYNVFNYTILGKGFALANR